MRSIAGASNGCFAGPEKKTADAAEASPSPLDEGVLAPFLSMGGASQGRYERLPQLAADLVNHKVAVIVAAYFPSAVAAKAATTTIPIVFISGVDPIAAGLVTSLNRPGGNLTGLKRCVSRRVPSA